MKNALLVLLAGGAMTSCLPYPRFVRVYQTPHYTGLFVDRNHRPVPGVLVRVANERQIVETGLDGRAILPACRRFQVIGFMVMDVWPRTVVQASWTDTTSGVRGRFQHDHNVRFVPDRRQLTVIEDTVILPLLR